MKNLRALARLAAVAALLPALSSAACHRGDPCLAACQKNTKALSCPRGDLCATSCQQLHTSPVCAAEMKAFETCFLREPSDHWMCDVDGQPALQQGYCTAERGKVMECFGRTPPTRPPESK